MNFFSHLRNVSAFQATAAPLIYNDPLLYFHVDITFLG